MQGALAVGGFLKRGEIQGVLGTVWRIEGIQGLVLEIDCFILWKEPRCDAKPYTLAARGTVDPDFG